MMNVCCNVKSPSLWNVGQPLTMFQTDTHICHYPLYTCSYPPPPNPDDHSHDTLFGSRRGGDGA